MLIRAYRLSDKIGLVILKLTAYVMESFLARASGALYIIRRSGAGLFDFIVTVVMTLLSFVLMLLTVIANLIRGALKQLYKIVRGFFGLLFSGGRVVASGATKTISRGSSSVVSTTRRASARAVTSANESMVRRASRAEIDAKVVEDPLRVQNRRLSFVVLILGITVIGALLWATDPSRSVAVQPVANADNTNNNLFIDETAVPTDEVALIAPIATPIPTATQIPVALQAGGTLAYVVRESAQTDIWAIEIGTRNPIRLTNDIADERDPAWSPDGSQLAYASRQDDNWEIYIYDVNTQQSRRMTFDLSFQANPKWSPDGLWLVYESYQGDNLDVYAVPIDGSESPVRITDHPTPDFAPVWSPSGREIAFVSWRDGNQDIYVFNLDTFEVFNLTQTPLRNENHPAWSPDGESIVYSASEQGSEQVFVMPTNTPGGVAQVVNFGRSPEWSPDGLSLTFAVDAVDRSASFLYAVPYNVDRGIATEVIAVPFGASDPTWTDSILPRTLVNSGGLPSATGESLYIEQFDEYQSGAPFRLSSLADIDVDRPFLSDRVNDSFNAFRQTTLERTGTDFLQNLEDVWWDLERRPDQGQPRRNWHMTGRAFALSRSNILGFPPQIELVREQIGVQTYWRLFVRVDEDSQSGQLGEPLRIIPWDFLSRNQGDVEAFNQGGRLRSEIPTGYYIDFTLLASDFGWERLPSSTDWRANTNGINYEIYHKPDGLDWYTAMLEIHTQGELINFAPTPTPAPITTDDTNDAS